MKRKTMMLIVPTLAQGGQERICLMTEDLLRKDQKLDVYTVIFDGKSIFYDVKGNRIINLDLPAQKGMLKKMIQLIRRILALKRIKKSRNIDYAYSFGTSANLVNVFSKGREKVLVGIRGYLSLRSRPQRMLVYPRADVVVCCSKCMAYDAKKLYGLTNTAVLTNPIDRKEIQKRAEACTVLLKKADEKIIITVGRIHEVKGYWHLVKAFAFVRKAYGNVKLVHIGAGNPNQYAELAQKLGIGNDVLFLGEKNNPFPYLANADLYVLSSVSEGFPNAMLEAMAMGLPVIAADCKTGPREILHEDMDDPVFEKEEIVEADYGILVPVMNRIANWDTEVFEKEETYLANAMLRMLSDEEMRNKYRIKAMERVQRYTTENYINEINRMLEGFR